MTSEAKSEAIPRRVFGQTGVEVSAIGLGGYDLGKNGVEREAIRIVHEALDAGIDFLDNAWEYNDGRSEEWMGKALEGRRDKVFLMTKVCTHGRDRQSLRRLRTDHLDLWQVHEVVYENEPDQHFMKGGVIEALEQAKREGKVRFVGFTGHKDPNIHLQMLAHDYPFDACQLPLNPFDASYRSFEGEVLPELLRRGIAPILGILYQNLEIVRGFKPMTAAEMEALRTRLAPLAADGRFELYKSSKKYDGDTGREQHGFPTRAQELTL
jgi:aryl-alcohol dehydrogenase-like predicted oxidoreductase